MGKWWHEGEGDPNSEDNRARLAWRVRYTRRRLRAGYRGTIESARREIAQRLHAEAERAVRLRLASIEEREAVLALAAERLARVRVYPNVPPYDPGGVHAHAERLMVRLDISGELLNAMRGELPAVRESWAKAMADQAHLALYRALLEKTTPEVLERPAR